MMFRTSKPQCSDCGFIFDMKFATNFLPLHAKV